MMYWRYLFVAALFSLGAGACTWPPQPSLPVAPGQTAQAVGQEGASATDEVLGTTADTAGRTLGGVGGTVGGVTRGMPAVGGGRLLR